VAGFVDGSQSCRWNFRAFGVKSPALRAVFSGNPSRFMSADIRKGVALMMQDFASLCCLHGRNCVYLRVTDGQLGWHQTCTTQTLPRQGKTVPRVHSYAFCFRDGAPADTNF
jgi:hypothetical protein